MSCSEAEASAVLEGMLYFTNKLMTEDERERVVGDSGYVSIDQIGQKRLGD